MLFYLFIIFHIFYSISCDISCYTAPAERNNFDYTVTPDHFPAELNNSALKLNSTHCSIFVVWERNPDHTIIELLGYDDIQAESIQGQLDVSVGYFMETSSSPKWMKAISYECSTDQCNSLSQLKLLLQGLTVNDSLSDLAPLLQPVGKFQGKWCYRASNTTSEKCNTTIPNKSCKHCVVYALMDQTGTEKLCATCSTYDDDHSSLSYHKGFNMTDQTNYSDWEILCGRKNCNTPAVSASIREKTYIDFNFNLFSNHEVDVRSIQ